MEVKNPHNDNTEQLSSQVSGEFMENNLLSSGSKDHGHENCFQDQEE